MLKSRTILDRIVDRFDLMKLYKSKYRQDARRRLLGSITVREDRKSGIIFLTVEDEDPKRAAEMANAFVEELKRPGGRAGDLGGGAAAHVLRGADRAARRSR